MASRGHTRRCQRPGSSPASRLLECPPPSRRQIGRASGVSPSTLRPADHPPLPLLRPRGRPTVARPLGKFTAAASCWAQERGASATPHTHSAPRADVAESCVGMPSWATDLLGRAPGTARTQPICGSSLWRRCAAAARCRQPQTFGLQRLVGALQRRADSRQDARRPGRGVRQHLRRRAPLPLLEGARQPPQTPSRRVSSEKPASLDISPAL